MKQIISSLNHTMTQNQNIIRSYYKKIDAQAVTDVLDLFSENASYERADSTFYGKAELTQFYQHDRKLIGIHALEHLFQEQDQVMVYGTFVGTNGQAKNITIDFADFFRLKDDQIIFRKTYLAKGSEVVR